MNINGRRWVFVGTISILIFSMGFLFSRSEKQPPSILPERAITEKISDFYSIDVPSTERVAQEYVRGSRIEPAINVLKDFFGGHPIQDDEFLEADQIVLDFLQDPRFSRQEKIFGLWDVIVSLDPNSIEAAYLIDTLDALSPIELTGELIRFYETVSSTDVKVRVLRLLRSSYNITDAPEDIALSQDQLTYIARMQEEIKAFMLSEIYATTDEAIFEQAISVYTNILPAEEAIDFYTDLLSSPNSTLNTTEVLSLSLELSLANEETQNKFIPPLLASIGSATSSQEEVIAFNDQFLTMLSLENMNQHLSGEVRDEMLNYLTAQRPEVPSAQASFDDYYRLYLWANARAAVSTSDEQSKAQFLINSLGELSPLELASVLNFVSDETTANINRAPGSGQLRRSLEAYNSTLSPGSGKELVESALQTLN